MTDNMFELAIIAFILGGIGYVLWRGGAANPVGTAKMQHDVGNMRHELQAVSRRIDAVNNDYASAASLKALDDCMQSEIAKVEKISISIGVISREVGELRSLVSEKNSTIEALREDLHEMRDGLNEAHRSRNVIRENVASLGSQIATTGRQVDRLYDVIVNKGMAS